METEKKEQKQEDFITYHDIFALALAYTSSTKFNSNHNQWHKAFYEICQKHKKNVPELRDIRFERRPPLPPQSEEVYDLRRVLGETGWIWEDGPFFKVTHMEDELKKKVINDEQERLRKYEEQIRDMALIFEKHLTLKK